MDEIFYIPAVGASVVVALILWWAIGRYHQSWLKKGLATAGAIFIGYVVYFVLGIILAITLAVIHPERAHETGLALGQALGQGFKNTLAVMFMAVTVVVLAVRGRSRTK